MNIGDMVYSVAFCLKKFVLNYPKKGVSKDEIDIILLDFVNYFAEIHQIDLKMKTTWDHREFKKVYDDNELRNLKILKGILMGSIESYKQEHIEERLFAKYPKTFYCTAATIYNIIDDFAKFYLNTQKNRLSLDITFEKELKIQRRYLDRESTIIHLLGILALKNKRAGQKFRIEIENLIMSTGFISIEDFEIAVKACPNKLATEIFEFCTGEFVERFPTIVWHNNRYIMKKVKDELKDINAMSQYEQKENLTKIVEFFKQQRQLRKYKI